MHCVKSVQIWSFFSSVFSSMRTKYGETLQSKCGKIQTIRTSLFGHISHIDVSNRLQHKIKSKDYINVVLQCSLAASINSLYPISSSLSLLYFFCIFLTIVCNFCQSSLAARFTNSRCIDWIPKIPWVTSSLFIATFASIKSRIMQITSKIYVLSCFLAMYQSFLPHDLSSTFSSSKERSNMHVFTRVWIFSKILEMSVHVHVDITKLLKCILN